MTDRRPTEAQIAAALRVHLPAQAPSGARRALLDAVASTPQLRPRLPVLGWVSDAGGYRYQATHPDTGAPWPAIPELALKAWATDEFRHPG